MEEALADTELRYLKTDLLKLLEELRGRKIVSALALNRLDNHTGNRRSTAVILGYTRSHLNAISTYR